MSDVDPGLLCHVREVKFAVADNPINRRKAQKVIQILMEIWQDNFPASCYPMSKAERGRQTTYSEFQP